MRGRGQALVEFALVLPLMLFVILGGTAVGLLIVNRVQLQHAANETAVAVAQHPSGCSVAASRAGHLLGRTPDSTTCSTTGHLVTIRLAHSFPQIAPFVPSSVVVTGRAVLRDSVEPLASPP